MSYAMSLYMHVSDGGALRVAITCPPAQGRPLIAGRVSVQMRMPGNRDKLKVKKSRLELGTSHC